MRQEKRKNSRIKSNLKLFVSDIDGVSHKRDINAIIINFGEKGICFESIVDFNIGKNCFLEFCLYNQKFPIKTVGTIIWKLSNPYLYTYGVNFVKLRLLDKFALIKSIKFYYHK